METTAVKKAPTNASYYVRIIGTLFAITAVVSILLALVNMVTKPTIERLAEEKKQASMASVLPDAVYSQLPYEPDGTILDVQGAFQDSTLIGYCVEVSTNGFGGAINMMVGVDTNGAVTGVEILSMSETAGLGSRASEPAFKDQFIGKAGTLEVKTDITPISGATITSKAVTTGVNAALAAVANLDLEGGAGNVD